MARTEKDFLNTLETYVKITQDRLRDGRIIDAHDELQIIEKMISQRKDEVNGTAAWENIREKAEPTLEALKEHPWKSHYSLEEMVERQAEGEDEITVGIEEAERYHVWDHYYDGKVYRTEERKGAKNE